MRVCYTTTTPGESPLTESQVFDYDDETTFPTKPKYRKAFDRGCSAANDGKPISDNPYKDDAPQRSKCWKRGWNHYHNKRTVEIEID